MRNLIVKSTMLLGAAVLMSFGADAQSLKVSVPFQFEANGKTLPAGQYSVRMTSENAGIYSMRNMDTHEGVLLVTVHPIANSAGEAKLVFQQAVDGYYLAEVWTGDNARAVRSPRGRNSILASTKPATRIAIAAQK